MEYVTCEAASFYTLKMKMHSENDSPVLSSGTECTVPYCTVLHCIKCHAERTRAVKRRYMHSSETTSAEVRGLPYWAAFRSSVLYKHHCYIVTKFISSDALGSTIQCLL